jgi:hypothetical protein
MNRDLRALIGASVLSSAGSLPLHLAPLIVAVVVTDGRMSVADAGWVATAVLLGTLATAILLPLLDATDHPTVLRAMLAGILLFGLLLSSFAGLLLVGWFIVGMCCGGFQYLGTSTAATHSRPAFAFPIRLGTVLCIAGLTVAAVRSIETDSYLVMLFVLAVVLGLITATGIVLYGPLKSRERAVDRDPASPLKYLALAIVFVLFVGQTGLLAYVVQQAARGDRLGRRVLGTGNDEGRRRPVPAAAGSQRAAEPPEPAFHRAWHTADRRQFRRGDDDESAVVLRRPARPRIRLQPALGSLAGHGGRHRAVVRR